MSHAIRVRKPYVSHADEEAKEQKEREDIGDASAPESVIARPGFRWGADRGLSTMPLPPAISAISFFRSSF